MNDRKNARMNERKNKWVNKWANVRRRNQPINEANNETWINKIEVLLYFELYTLYYRERKEINEGMWS